jgi:hypothetical protein
MEQNHSISEMRIGEHPAWKVLSETYQQHGEYFGQIWRMLDRVSRGGPKSEYSHAFSLSTELAKRLQVEMIGCPYDRPFVLRNGQLGSFFEKSRDEARTTVNLAREGKRSFWGKRRLMVAVKEKQPTLTVSNLYWNMHDLGGMHPHDPIKEILHDLGAIAMGGKMSNDYNPFIPVTEVAKAAGLSVEEVAEKFNCDMDEEVPDTWLFDSLCQGELKISGINEG